MGMPLTMGVDMVDIRSKTNDAKSKIVRGVAGLNMAGIKLQQIDHPNGGV